MDQVKDRGRSTNRRGGAGLLLVVVVAMLTIGVGNASALVAQLSNGKLLSYQPVPGAGPAAVLPFSESEFPLLYHGGAVMPENTNYTIYWLPPKGPKYALGYTGGVNVYFKDLAHDSAGVQNVES